MASLQTEKRNDEKLQFFFRDIEPCLVTNRIIFLCEPLTTTVQIFVPVEISPLHVHSIETEIWSNVRDKYSSSGRWHPIPMRKTSFQKTEGGYLLVFEVSLLPIITGRFEFTIRGRFAKVQKSEWIWAGNPGENVYITVDQSPLRKVGLLSPGSVREMLNWFEENCEADSENNLRNYNAALLGALTLDQEDEVVFCYFVAHAGASQPRNSKALVHLLKKSKWLSVPSNSKRVLIWSVGSSCLAGNLTKSISSFQQPATSASASTASRKKRSYVYTPDEKRDTLALISLLKLGSLNRPGEEEDLQFLKKKKSISRTPSLTIETPQLMCGQTDSSGILFEILLDIIRSCSPILTGASFIQVVLKVYVSSNDSLVSMYLYQIVRAIYDKPSIEIDGKLYANGIDLVSEICNMLYLHCEWDNAMRKTSRRSEIGFDQPETLLDPIFKILRNLIDQRPGFSQNRSMQAVHSCPTVILRNTNDNGMPCVPKDHHLYGQYLCDMTRCLLFLVAHLGTDFTDHRKLYQLLQQLCSASQVCQQTIFIRLFKLWNKSTEHTCFILNFMIGFFQSAARPGLSSVFHNTLVSRILSTLRRPAIEPKAVCFKLLTTVPLRFWTLFSEQSNDINQLNEIVENSKNEPLFRDYCMSIAKIVQRVQSNCAVTMEVNTRPSLLSSFYID